MTLDRRASGAGEVGAGGDEDFAAAEHGAAVDGLLEGGGVFGFAVGGGAEVADVEYQGGACGGGLGPAGGSQGEEGAGDEMGFHAIGSSLMQRFYNGGEHGGHRKGYGKGRSLFACPDCCLHALRVLSGFI